MSTDKKEEIAIVKNPKAFIQRVRTKHVILDADLAEIYGVKTKRLNEQVKRNKAKFPEDFCFQLSEQEWNDLKSQNATSNNHGGRRVAPYAFTEHGALQVATVINSELANSISVFVIRAFIDMREVISLQEETKIKQIDQHTESSKFLKDVSAKLQQALEQVMDTVIDKDQGSTIASESQEIIKKSISYLKGKLDKPGLENEEIAARITKLLAEAESERANAHRTWAETEQMKFNTMMQKFKLFLEAQKLFSEGAQDPGEIRKIDAFIEVLNEQANK